MLNNAKLSQSEVQSILSRAASGETSADLAKEFEVTKSAIEYHIRKAAYRHDMPPEEEGQTNGQEETQFYSKRVPLATGGEITLSYTVNLFDLSEREFNFFLAIMRAIRAYEQTQ